MAGISQISPAPPPNATFVPFSCFSESASLLSVLSYCYALCFLVCFLLLVVCHAHHRLPLPLVALVPHVDHPGSRIYFIHAELWSAGAKDVKGVYPF